MNVAYKHLDAKLKIAELTLGQWLGVTAGLGVGILWGFYVSPLGTYLTLASAVYLGAIPAGIALLASFYEIDVLLIVRSALRWRRLEGRFVPGPGASARGYVVRVDANTDSTASEDQPIPDLSHLWRT